MNPKEVKRIYNGSDAFMLQEARIIHGLVNTDLARFTAFDSTFTAAAQTAYLNMITAADTVVDDSTVVSQLKQSTENLQNAMEAAKAKYGEVKYYALKAFPNSPGTQGEFGMQGYDDARKNATKMVGFLDELSKTAVKYQTQLIAAGYNATAIAAIAILRTDLQNKNTIQKSAKRHRPKLTEDRVTVLNNCYSRMVQINAAAQIVYATDYAKQKQFVYKHSSESRSDIENFIGTVSAGHAVLIGEVDYDDDNVFTFTNTGPSELVFCLSSSIEMEGITITVATGDTQTHTGSELNADATKIVVKNIGSTSGSYEVEVEV